jgi:FdhD protein
VSDKGLKQVAAVCVQHGAAASEASWVVVEEPLEIRVAGDAVALTMRTPGDDRQLALGFLFAEGVIGSLADVGSVYHCGRSDDPRYGNAIEVVPGPGARLDFDALARTRRVGITQSACGVCGRDGIDDLLTRIAPLADEVLLEPGLIARVPGMLALHQPNFARTGGLHAACAITAAGEVLASAEDVGRHNAVDKVVGKLLLAERLPRAQADEQHTARVLAVSGRASFEIVQKAAAAGFVCVASVSAPSSLAVETADALRVTLASFVREGRFTLYAHPARVRPCHMQGAP